MTGYTWTVSAGGTITAGTGTNAITVTWSTAGAHTVSVNYINGNSCTAASATSHNVTVNPLPVPTVTGPASVCVNSTGNVYTTETGMTGYTWTVSAGGTITAGAGTNAITVTWSTAGAHTVSVNYTNGNSCTAASATSYSVTVNPLPVPTIAGSASPNTGSPETYTTEAGMTGYTWTVSAGGTITAGTGTNTITVTWTTPGAQSVSVNYLNPNGCSAASATIYSLIIYVRYNLLLNSGWNWFSVNTTISNMTIGNVLTNVTSNGDFIKDQVSSATYYTGTGWFGTLTTISPVRLYKIRVQNSCNISYSGTPVDVIATGIILVTGWNWIGYLPQSAMPIASALSSLSFSNLDYIKSQTKSSTYYSGTGWFGTLTQLLPGEGYMMKLANPATLRYPGSKKGVMISGESDESYINAADYEFNGTVTASVYLDSIIAGSENDKLFAYVNGQLRGAASGNYFAPVGTYLFPLMVHSNAEEGEIVGFKYYNAETNKLYPCKETIVFSKDMIVADAYKSFKLNAGTVKAENIQGEETGGLRLKTYPNPFDQFLNIEYAIAEGSRIRLAVYDPYGKLIKVLVDGEQKADSYLVRWDSSMNSEGMYIIKLQAGLKQVIRKVILVKK
jgi:hypothetical protein